jgi:arylsulfatase
MPYLQTAARNHCRRNSMNPESRCRFLKGLMRLAAGLCFSSTLAAKPMNIVVLYADDWRHDTLGCAGHPVLKTPHLDRLAGEGTRFTRSCVTTSICGVSRASLFTGQWMSRHGNPGFAAFKTPWEETYPGLLRANGYHVGHIGKWHNGVFPAKNFDFGRSYSGTHWIKQDD